MFLLKYHLGVSIPNCLLRSCFLTKNLYVLLFYYTFSTCFSQLIVNLISLILVQGTNNEVLNYTLPLNDTEPNLGINGVIPAFFHTPLWRVQGKFICFLHGKFTFVYEFLIEYIQGVSCETLNM